MLQKKTVCIKDAPIPFTCNVCGDSGDYIIYDAESPLFYYMTKNHVCYNCAFWLDIIEHPIYNHEIIDGFYFIVHPFVHRPYHATGFSLGREYYIRKNNGKLIKTNNIECRGEIPAQFREQLSDTAVFLPMIAYQNLVNHPFECHARGCWDRYTCLRYNIEYEREEGAFNEVPENHIPGEEHCPSYAPQKHFKY